MSFGVDIVRSSAHSIQTFSAVSYSLLLLFLFQREVYLDLLRQGLLHSKVVMIGINMAQTGMQEQEQDHQASPRYLFAHQNSNVHLQMSPFFQLINSNIFKIRLKLVRENKLYLKNWKKMWIIKSNF